MPKYQITGPDGKKYRITGENPDGAMNALKSHLGAASDVAKPDEAAPAADPNETGFLNNAVRSMGRGVLGLGSYLDEMDAATNATLAPIIDPLLPDSYQKLPQENWQQRYDKALEIQRGQDKKFDQENPKTSLGMKITGGLMSGGALLKAAPAAGEVILGNAGKTLIGKIGATSAAGGLTGLVQGFGEGEGGVENRVKEARNEGKIGAVLAPALMPVGAAVNWGVKAGRDWLASPKVAEALAGLSPAARKYVENQLSDPAALTAMKDKLDKLGPEAMMADVSPEWLGVARGAASKPGMRNTVVAPLEERAAAANARLRADIRSSLGEAIIPSQVDDSLKASQRVVGKNYDTLFENSKAVDTEGLANELDAAATNLRGPEQTAVKGVREYLNIPGTDQLDPNPQALHATRQAIDGLLKTEQNPQVVRQLSMARQQVDDILNGAVPSIKEVDSQFSELARQRDALEMGRPILNNEASALRPEEVDKMLTEGALPKGVQIGPSAVPFRMKQSVRAEIERALGTKANDTTALRNIVRGEGDWNRDKLGLLFGQENADNALSAIDRETVFADTANRVVRGSDTAMANRFGDFLDEASKPKVIPSDTTLTGLALKGGKSVVNALMKNDADTAALQFADQIGRLSVAKGDSRDAIVQALLNRGQRLQQLNDPKVQALVKALVQSSGRAAVPTLSGMVE